MRVFYFFGVTLFCFYLKAASCQHDVECFCTLFNDSGHPLHAPLTLLSLPQHHTAEPLFTSFTFSSFSPFQDVPTLLKIPQKEALFTESVAQWVLKNHFTPKSFLWKALYKFGIRRKV